MSLLREICDQAVDMRASARNRGTPDARLGLTLPPSEFRQFAREFVEDLRWMRAVQGLPEDERPDHGPEHITFIEYSGVHIAPFAPPAPPEEATETA